MHLLVVGGSDGGIAAALRARELDPTVEVSVVVADAYPNYSICGLPYYLAGDVPDWRSLAHRTRADLEATGMRLLLDTVARRLEPAGKQLTVTSANGGGERQLAYDQLVIATGAEPIRPPIPGLDLAGVHVLHTMADSFALHQAITARQPRSAVIIGAGYIGLEMAEALTTRGLTVTQVEQLPAVLPTVDPQLGQLVAQELTAQGVRVVNGVQVQAIRPATAGRLTVVGSPEFEHQADLVLVVVGVRPSTELAVEAGARTGVRGAIQVTQHMATTLPDIWAAGDCVETYHALLDRTAYLPLGTTAHKQGRVAGENAVGGDREFAGSLGTQVVKVFDLAVARTGLRDHEAVEAGFDPATVASTADDHKAYYPGAHTVHLRVTGDRQTGQLLGVQLLGHRDAQVPKRIDIPATALFHRMRVDGLNDLDLSYTPPFGSPWDTIQMGAEAWLRETSLSRPATGIEAAP
jgi:NADPH-dependent 2,4-dienoyl-CoA reductase/sulfur reductase-like enzyme